MRKKAIHLVAAMLLYWLGTLGTDGLLVMPPHAFRVTSFLPPILGLMWGPVAVPGVVLAEVLLGWEFFFQFLQTGDTAGLGIPLRNMLCSALAAYLPFRLWHSLWVHRRHPFALHPPILFKFVLILLVVTLVNAVIIGLTTQHREVRQILLSAGFNSATIFDYVLFRATTDCNLALFFGMPVFLFLAGRNYPFYLPGEARIRHGFQGTGSHMLFPMVLYFFLLALFLLLDLSGAIYGLDRLDVWQMFHAEIITTANLAMVAFTYILLRFRYSIMNDLMMLEVITVCVCAFALGGISYLSMSRITDNRITETLDTMSHLSRERLSNSLGNIRAGVRSMHDLALQELGDYERFRASSEYREQYLRNMERLLYPIAYSTDGCISFYLRCTPEIAGPRAGFYWTRPPGHWEGTHNPFQPRYVTDLNEFPEEALGWYYQPLRRRNPTWIEPYVDVNTNAYVISYSMPLYVGDTPIGIIGMDVDFEYLIHEIRRMSVYEHGFAYLTDRYGRVLFHKDYPPGSTIPPDPNLHVRETYLNSGIWLGIAVPAYDIYADRNTMLIHLTVGMLLIAMAISFFSIWLAIRGIRPLLVLTQAVKKIAAGNLEVELAYKSRNELGILTRGIREMATKLEIYVYHDKLTGLKNTAAYARYVEGLKKRSGEKEVPYALVVFDANFLKRINDHYGHEAGNELIRRAAALVSHVFSRSQVFRIGGDEFIAILEDQDYRERRELVADFIALAKEARFTFDGQELPVSVACGMAEHREGEDYTDTFQEADAAMYEHKAAIKAKYAGSLPDGR